MEFSVGRFDDPNGVNDQIEAHVSLAAMIAQDFEDDLSSLVANFELIKAQGKRWEEIEMKTPGGEITLTFVIAESGSMLVVKDSNGKEAVLEVPEVYLDPKESAPEWGDILEGQQSFFGLKAAMVRGDLSHVETPGGYSVHHVEPDGYRFQYDGKTVRLNSAGSMIPKGTDLFAFWATVERLRVAAEAQLDVQ